MINGSVGFAKEIIYAKNEISACNLPICVLVGFGDIYTGESFFLNDPTQKITGYQSSLLKLPSTGIIEIYKWNKLILRFR